VKRLAGLFSHLALALLAAGAVVLAPGLNHPRPEDRARAARAGVNPGGDLTGARITEADWRLFTTLVRFDPVYHGHFKRNRNRLADFPNLWAYTRELYQWPGVAATTDFGHVVRHYHFSHDSINPHRILPTGPRIDWLAPHGRDRLKAA